LRKRKYVKLFRPFRVTGDNEKAELLRVIIGALKTTLHCHQNRPIDMDMAPSAAKRIAGGIINHYCHNRSQGKSAGRYEGNNQKNEIKEIY